MNASLHNICVPSLNHLTHGKDEERFMLLNHELMQLGAELG